MAVAGPDVNGMSWFECDYTKFSTGATLVEVQQYGETYLDILRRWDDWQIKDGAKNGSTYSITYISARYKINEIPTATPMFSGSSNNKKKNRYLFKYACNNGYFCLQQDVNGYPQVFRIPQLWRGYAGNHLLLALCLHTDSKRRFVGLNNQSFIIHKLFKLFELFNIA
jgi:hypothetical protein